MVILKKISFLRIIFFFLYSYWVVQSYYNKTLHGNTTVLEDLHPYNKRWHDRHGNNSFKVQIKFSDITLFQNAF